MAKKPPPRELHQELDEAKLARFWAGIKRLADYWNQGKDEPEPVDRNDPAYWDGNDPRLTKLGIKQAPVTRFVDD